MTKEIPLQWRLIMRVSNMGYVIGALAVMGFLSAAVEPFAWAVLWLIAALLIARLQATPFFRSGLYVGLLSSLFAGILKIIFIDRYLALYPDFANAPLAPQMTVLLIAAVTGIIGGIILGAMAHVAARFVSPRK